MTRPVPDDKLRLGGMALRNGLLVHGPTHWAAAVRDDHGLIQVASGRKLDGEELRDFFAERAHIEKLVASTPVQHKLADASDLRQSRDQ